MPVLITADRLAHRPRKAAVLLFALLMGGSCAIPSPGRCSAPVFDPPAGSYTAPLAVTLATSTTGAVIRYTLDGSTPDAMSPRCTGPVILEGSTTIRATACLDGLLDSVTARADYEVGVLLATRVVGPAGRTINLAAPAPGVRAVSIEIGPGVFDVDTSLQILHSMTVMNPPPHFVTASPCIEVRPCTLTLPADVRVGLPYDDEDVDGLVDGTAIPVTELYPAYYDGDSACWGPLQIDHVDTDERMVWFRVDHLEPFALWAAERDPSPGPGLDVAAMHVIGYDWTDWPASHGGQQLTASALAADLASHGVFTVFVHAYSPDPQTAGAGAILCEDGGGTAPAGLTGFSGWFSLSSVIAEAHARGISVVVNLGCFTDTSPPHHHGHRTHLLEVIDYFAEHYAIDGIMLDHIRYDDVSPLTIPSFGNIEAVTSFVRDVRDHHAGGLPIYLNVMPHDGSGRELLTGQRFADLAAVCEYLCPMIYVAGAGSTDALSDLVLRTTLTRTADHGAGVLPILRTWDPMTGTELGELIEAGLETYADGAAFFRYIFMDPAEWAAIDSYTF